MTYHEVVSKILDSLRQNNCWFETFEHEPVRTSEEAAKTRPGYSLHQGAKAMIVKAKGTQTRFVMLVLPADLRFDNSRLKVLLQAKDIAGKACARLQFSDGKPDVANRHQQRIVSRVHSPVFPRRSRGVAR